MTTQILVNMLEDVSNQIECISIVQQASRVRPGFSAIDNVQAGENISKACTEIRLALAHLRKLL